MDHFCCLCFSICLYYAVVSVPCSLVNTCWERADLLALLRVMFSYGFVTLSYGVSFQVCHLIVSIPDLCLLFLLIVLLYACSLTIDHFKMKENNYQE